MVHSVIVKKRHQGTKEQNLSFPHINTKIFTLAVFFSSVIQNAVYM